MKKYQSPITYVGIDALHEVIISLDTWVKWLHPLTYQVDKPQIELLVKIIRKYVYSAWLKEI